MKPLFFGTLKGITVFLIIASSLLFLLCFAALRFDEPAAFIPLFSNIALFLSAFFGGRFSVSNAAGKLISGLVFGISLALILMIISLLFSSVDGMFLSRMLLTVLVSVLGALSGKKRDRIKSSTIKRKSIVGRYGAYR